MHKNKYPGQPKGCDSTPGEKSCKKRQKNSNSNRACLCKSCKAKDEKGKRISKIC